jgi:F-type H+-transporting ATPase subunit delta
VETSGGIEAGLAGRYASALFALASEANNVEIVEKNLNALRSAIAGSGDLAALIASPVVTRADAARGIAAVATALKLDSLTTKFLGVLAQNRRLVDLPAMIAAFGGLAANARGEVTATVTSAHPLTGEQAAALRSQLKTRVGRDVAIDTKIDPAILGGLVVQLGSQLIDGSIKTRLNSFAQAMKG